VDCWTRLEISSALGSGPLNMHLKIKYCCKNNFDLFCSFFYLANLNCLNTK
jgi:hypothetical protein